MAYDEALRSISLDADASLGIFTGVPGLPGSASPNGGKQYHLVKYTGRHQAGLATAAGDAFMGVLESKPQQPGAAATINIAGVTKVTAGAAISAGQFLVPDAQGRAVPSATSGTTPTKLQAQEVAAAAGHIFSALFV